VALNQHEPAFSAQTFEELETRLWRPKFDRHVTREERDRFLGSLVEFLGGGRTVIPPEIAAVRYSRDPDDDKFIHAALAAHAPWLVTGDRDLLDVAPIPGLRILSPADAIALPDFLGTADQPAPPLS